MPEPFATEVYAQDKGEHLSPLGLVVTSIGRLQDMILPVVGAFYATRDSGLGAVWGILAVVALILFFRWLSWARFRYFVGEDEVRIEHGVFSRSARSIPYDRIADVTIEQPALARLFGLAVARFETGGGKGEEAELRFVSESEAERLRQTVREHKAISAAGPGADVPDATVSQSQTLFAMDLGRVLTLGFYSFSLVIFAVLFGVAQQLDFLLPFDWEDLGAWLGLAEQGGEVLAGLDRSVQVASLVGALTGLVVLGIGTGVIRIVLRDYGFLLERTAKGLRRRRGLLTRTDLTIPIERVQGVELGTGPIRARRGWHHMKLISLAGGSDEKFDHMVAPLAKLEELAPILAELGQTAPDAKVRFVPAHFGPWRDRALLRSAGIAAGASIAYLFGVEAAWMVIVPISALAMRDWLAWRREAWAIDQGQLYSRGGWWSRLLVFAPQLHVQSVTLTRGPLERRHGLASIQFGIAGGGLHFSGVPQAKALAIREQVLALVTPVDFCRLNRPR